MAGIPLDKAELLALLLETLFYGATFADSRREVVQGLIAANYRSGIFLTLFILLVVMSFVEREIRIANQSFILPVAALMMVLATAVGILYRLNSCCKPQHIPLAPYTRFRSLGSGIYDWD